MTALNGNDFYGKADAKMINGLAILLMMTHHFFGFDSWLQPDVHWVSAFSIGGIEVERMIAGFGKLCVGLFAFGSGYAICGSSARLIALTRT